MAKPISISTYLSLNFTRSFFTIFLPLFFIGSLVFIIKLSALTASLQIHFLEMVQLFGYNLPSILFYTLPISFMVATVITLLRLSNDNELMAIFALGTRAKNIMYRFLIIATLFSTVLLIISLALMPQTKQQFTAFKQQKAAQAQVNINPSKLGQKFGNLFVYVKSKTANTLENIVIYNKDKGHSDQLFVAKSADIKTLDSIVTLTLKEGSGYTFSERSLKEIDYKKMQVFQSLKSEAFTYQNIVSYWAELALNPKKQGRIFFFIFASLIPLLSLYIIAAFSIINPRYNKNYAYAILSVTAILFYAIASLLEKNGNLLLIATAIGISIVIGQLLFKHFVSRYF